MGKRIHLVLFTLDEKIFGLPLEMVNYVHPAVAPLALDKSPSTVPGLVDIHGVMMPLVDMRTKCGQESKPLSPDDVFIEMTASGKRFALWVDKMLEVVDMDEADLVDPKELIPGITMVERIAPRPEGMAVIYDVVRFFAPEYSLSTTQA